MSAAVRGVDRSRPPAPGPRKPFAFPPFRHRRLDNGLEILAAAMPRVPLADLQVLIPAGGELQPPDLPGLASLHGGLLDEGTGRRSSLEIARLVEGLGGSLVSGAGWNMAYAEVGVLAEHFDSALELLAEIARSPEFPEAEVERLRLERAAEILRRRDQPASLADQRFAAAVYGGTVYGEPLIGTEASLERLDRETLRAFHRRHVGPGGSTVIAVGDLDPEDAIARVEEHFADWPRVPRPEPPTLEPPALERTQVHVVDRPGSSQVQLQLGHASVPRRHPDYPRIMLLNAIFGGKFTSRINLNLREEHGYTYGAQSVFVRRRGPGPFFIRAAVATEVAGDAVEQLLFEMRRIRDEPVSREELEETQDYLIGVFPYTLQTIGDLAKRLEAIAVFDLPKDYYETFPAELAGVTRDDVLDAARAHLHPDRLAIVAVGPADALTPQLERFGPVSV